MPSSFSLNVNTTPFSDQQVPVCKDDMIPVAIPSNLLVDFDFENERTYTNLQSVSNSNNNSSLIRRSADSTIPDSPVPSPTGSSCSLFESIISNPPPCEHSEQSWERVHPHDWNSQQVIEWIFHVVNKWNFDPYKVHAEKFCHLMGQDLTQMSRNDFISCDPSHGEQFYKCYQNLLENMQFKPPSNFQQSPYDVQNDSDSNETDSTDLPTFNPDRPMDMFEQPNCAFSDLQSDSEEDISVWQELEPPYTSSLGPFEAQPRSFHSAPFHQTCLPEHTGPSQYPERPLQPLPTFTNSPVAQTRHSGSPAAGAQKRRPGRPPKNPLGPSYNGQKMNRPGRKQGQTSKGQKQLWKFIRGLLLNQDYNPHLIRWENKDEGVFRIINSEEVARMWGDEKNNDKMTYEKMSRAMRFCRDQGYFSSVPKDGNYPKKLCFRFGQKATDWH